MVVEFQIALQRRCEFCRRPESRLADDLADAPVEAFNHAVRLWMAWRNQPMLNAKLLAEAIKDMVCWRRRQIDPGCRFQLTQLKTSGTVVARGFSGYGRGSPKIGSLGQKFVGANTVAAGRPFPRPLRSRMRPNRRKTNLLRSPLKAEPD